MRKEKVCRITCFLVAGLPFFGLLADGAKKDSAGKVKTFFTPAPVDRKQNSIFSQSADEKLLLSALTSLSKSTQAAPRKIHSQRFWENLPEPKKQNYARDTKFGQRLYNGVLSYSDDLQTLPLNEFQQKIRALSQLRDGIYTGGKLGNLVLADKINRVIYWEILMRLASANGKEVEPIADLAQYYSFMWSDWRAVGRSFSEELQFTLNEAAVRNAKPAVQSPFNSPDWKFAKMDSLGIKYLALESQIKPHLKFEDADRSGAANLGQVPQVLDFFGPERFFVYMLASSLREDRDIRPFLLEQFALVVVGLAESGDAKNFEARRKVFEDPALAKNAFDRFAPQVGGQSSPVGLNRRIDAADFVSFWREIRAKDALLKTIKSQGSSEVGALVSALFN